MVTSSPSNGLAQVDRALDALGHHLGSSMIGVYLFGSSVAGGLRPRSDVDLLVASRRSLRGQPRSRLIDDLLAISAPVGEAQGRPLEVTLVVLGDVIPWRYPPTRELQFGEWLRRDLLAAHIPPPRPDPDLTILLTLVRQHGIPLLGPAASDLFEPVPAADVRRAILALVPELVAGARGDERNVLLTVARMWVTLATGEILPKDVAAERMLEVLPVEHRDVLALARSGYRGETRDDWSGREREVEAFLQHASAALTAMDS
ncbi:aminoglycoside adenylyltransferase family protein [Sorangium sp. So ce185]|uniref:aminoglycoside adenylyltransferase family protein n=1 Tax=Sorangium sp. So ce185 TaxID=3133287 RepID=UPI003F5F92D9